ncbi:MAG: 23S rRNA (guanosine(2251)-2'-O)-methyltransferase RlmB [Alphaproteobacteria bacterium]
MSRKLARESSRHHHSQPPSAKHSNKKHLTTKQHRPDVRPAFRPKTKHPKIKNPHYYLYGFHAVAAALLNPQREKIKLHLTPEVKAKLEKNSALKNILSQLATESAVNITNRYGIDQRFADILENAPHQGVVFETKPIAHIDLKHYLENIITINQSQNHHCFLLLDKLQDAHNIGAILRSADYFNIDGIVLPERHTAPESAAMAKSASGALESIPLIRVSNLSQALQIFKKNGFWIYGLQQNGEHHLENIMFDKKSILVLGQEGDGISAMIDAKTDFSIAIHRTKHNNQIDSLNVSNAVAIALYHWSITAYKK